MFQRKSPRAQRYDYSSQGMYFITICTKDREHYFGKIMKGEMQLSEIGKICDQALKTMLQKRPSIDMYEYVIMPNHVHLLFLMNDCRDMGLPCPKNDLQIQPFNNNRTPQADVPTSIITHQTLSSVIGGRKSSVSKQCHGQGLVFARQSRYHDHIVRNEQEYEKIRHYIQVNPRKWGEGRFHG